MSPVSAELRRLVIERAGGCCEYCRRSQKYHKFSFHLEHVIPEKHGGETVLENFALSCPDCNAYEGADIGSSDRDTGQFAPLCHPRRDKWEDHFFLSGAQIEARTPVGRVTVFLLRLNHPRHVAERTLLIELGHYPCRSDIPSL